MKNSKVILSAFLTLTLLSPSGVVFADNNIKDDALTQDKKEKVEQNKAKDVDSFNIEDYISAAIQNSKEIRAQEKSLEAARKGKETALDAFADIPFNVSKKDPYLYLKVSQLDIMDADLNELLVENSLDILNTSVTLGLYEQYIGLIKVMDSIEFQKKLIENKEKRLSRIKEEYTIGKLSKSKYEEEERNIEKLKLQLENLNLNKTSMLMNLNNVIGQPMLKEYSNYIRPDTDKKVADLNFDDYLKQALSNRMEISFGERKLEVKKTQYQKVKKLFPSYKNEHNIDYKDCLDEAQLNLDKAKLDIEIEAREVTSTLENIKMQIEKAERNLSLANFNYNMAKGKFDMGLITKEQLEEVKFSCEQIENSIKGLKLDLWMFRQKVNYGSGLGPGVR